MAVALDSHFRVTVARECLHDGNVEPSIEEQMNGGMAQVVEAERSHTRDWPEAMAVLRAKPEAIVVGLLSVSATSLPAAMLEPRHNAGSSERATKDLRELGVFICGDRDFCSPVPWPARRLVVAGGSHFIHAGKDERFYDIVRSFLEMH